MMTIRFALARLSPLALLAGCAAGLVQTPVTGNTHWVPNAIPSVMRPMPDEGGNGWSAYAGLFDRAPSLDQHLEDPILDGAIDIHAHYGPDTYARQWDAFEIATRAEARGMRAIVIKSHWTESASMAYMVRHHATSNLEVFGGIALNVSVGGINPMGVRVFAEMDGHFGKVVWMPTHDSEHEVRTNGETRPFVRVSENGVLLPQVLEVLDLVAQYDLTLATGHVTAEEMLAIVREARSRGIERIILTHPGLGPQYTDPTPAELREAVAMGGFVEVVANTLYSPEARAPMVEMIRALGPEHCIVATDSGLQGTPNHADAMVMSAQILREEGFTEGELDLMFKANPARVLGLEVLPR